MSGSWFATVVSSGSLVAYLLFYTAYDKQEKKLKSSNLISVLTFGESVDKTLVELNKALSLAGLTVLCLAFCLPSFAVETAKEEVFLQTQLCWHAVTMLVVHSIFSLVKYYNTKLIPGLSEWKSMPSTDMKDKKTFMTGIKKLSLFWGMVSQYALLAALFFVDSPNVQALLMGGVSVLFGISHFYSMEIDFKFRLQVRPFAYLPFPLAACAIFVAAKKFME